MFDTSVCVIRDNNSFSLTRCFAVPLQDGNWIKLVILHGLL